MKNIRGRHIHPRIPACYTQSVWSCSLAPPTARARKIIREQTQQHTLIAMVLEARALEPLHDVALAIAKGLDLRLGDWLAEQRQALGRSLSSQAIELQTIIAPIA